MLWYPQAHSAAAVAVALTGQDNMVVLAMAAAAWELLADLKAKKHRQIQAVAAVARATLQIPPAVAVAVG
jgi:hypothetical protein